METRRIGSLDVTVVGLGCNNFGGRLDEPGSIAVVHAALDAGINFFDTADVYGAGKSEEILSKALGSRRGSAQQRGVIIATKFGHKLDDQRQGAHPGYVKRAVEDSLRRLNTDAIDLYQLHRPDPNVPIADTLGALNELVQAGKVREIGCSNFSAAQLREAEAVSVQTGGARFVSVQNEYHLLSGESEHAVLAECEQLGIAYIPYFPLAAGLLTGKYRKGQPLPDSPRAQGKYLQEQLTDENLDRIEALIAFSESQGHTILELAFAWLASQKEIASVIAGAMTPDQVRANARAAAWTLTEADFAEVDRILTA